MARKPGIFKPERTTVSFFHNESGRLPDATCLLTLKRIDDYNFNIRTDNYMNCFGRSAFSSLLECTLICLLYHFLACSDENLHTAVLGAPLGSSVGGYVVLHRQTFG